MNYYRFYPGDYHRDTSCLSLTEHGAYRLLLDYCYGSDTDLLPSRETDLFRITCAITRDERAAVRRVVELFFPDRRNPRVSSQLAEDLRQKEVAMAKSRKGNKARWGSQEESPKESPKESPGDDVSDSPEASHKESHTIHHTPYPIPHTPEVEGYTPSLPDAEVKKQTSLSCTELCAEEAQTPVLNGSDFFMNTCRTGEQWEVPLAKMKEWKESYPDVNVIQTLGEIRQWLRDNPTKRKTSRGMVRFIGAWMQREQDKPDGSNYGKRTQH